MLMSDKPQEIPPVSGELFGFSLARQGVMYKINPATTPHQIRGFQAENHSLLEGSIRRNLNQVVLERSPLRNESSKFALRVRDDWIFVDLQPYAVPHARRWFLQSVFVPDLEHFAVEL